MVGQTANRVLDKLHQATVGVLILSTFYFGVEAFRATWYIQKHKAEQRVSVVIGRSAPSLPSSSSGQSDV